MKKIIIIGFLLILLYVTVKATIINIPDDFPTIQQGINVSVDGDTVLVQPNIYFENINYNGKNITVASLFLTTQDTMYISQTIINGNQNGSVVTFESGEDSSAILCGFTITNGLGYSYSTGGGITCLSSSPRIESVTITNNIADHGGGILCYYNSNPFLENITITNNSASYAGGGIYSNHSNPVLENLTITNNSASSDGGGIYGSHSDMSLNNITVTNNTAYADGGGIVCFWSDMILENIIITNNSASNNGGGLGSYCSSLELESVSICENTASNFGGGIHCYLSPDDNLIFHQDNRCSIYLNDNGGDRLFGKDVYYSSNNYINTVSVVVDTFTVFNPTAYYASPIEYFTFDILNSAQELINADLYVSPTGDNSNSGLNANDPFKTIQYSLSRIFVDSLNLNTIHLASGIYSQQSNGESFPIDLFDYVSLCGFSEDETILDADSIGSVIRYIQQQNSGTISNFTVRNGNADYGGGIYCSYSQPSLENITLSNNSALYDGGGIFCSNSEPVLENVTILNNYATHGGGFFSEFNSNPILDNVTILDNNASFGGGIKCEFSDLILLNSTISNNVASVFGGGIHLSTYSFIAANTIISNNYASEYGGGIYSHGSSIELKDISITDNFASFYGGGIYFYLNPANYLNFHEENRCNIYLNNTDGERLVGKDIYYDSWGYPSTISVVVDTFTVFNPTSYYAYPTGHLTFDILNNAQELINADLYVSPTGDNTNSGLNANEPLLTIQYALSQIYADSLNECTIYLAPGVYSPQSNGEFFPIDLLDHISLCGTSEEVTILDANSTGSVIRFLQQENAGTISDLTIRNGSASSGGGIHCVYSNPFLENITIANNSVSNCGSGIYCYHSNPILENVTISDNIASSDTLYISGAGIYCSDSNPILDSCTIINNYASNGGGIYCIFSNPVITNTSITNNSALSYGGGLSFVTCNPVLENSIVSDNSASYKGGGIYSGGSTIVLTRVSITANVGPNNGGGIYLNSSDLIADNITISDNYASNGGGGIYCFSSHPCLLNCILWNDYPNEVYFFDQGFTNTITVSYSDIQGGENGIVTNNNGTVNWLAGNIDEDPLFVDAANGDYHLTASSPCIDAGDPNSPLDPDGTIADMGAFYFDQNAEIEDSELHGAKYSLSNFPNPFNPETTISYQLPVDHNVDLKVFNIKGQLVETLVNDYKPAGEHSIIWNAEKQASGIYFVRLETGNKEHIKKMILLR